MTRNVILLPKLIDIALEQGRDAFLDASPYPVLLPRAVNLGELERSKSEDEGDTMHHIPVVGDEVTLYETPRVLLVRRDSNLGEGSLISLGRTADTDLVLSDHSISKEHATFHRESAQHWELEDTFSKNGTWIDDMRLIPGVPVKIESKEVLRFGRINLRFLSPEDFYDELLSTTES